MAVHRVKHTFTAGELSPLLSMRSDFQRFKNGCDILENAIITPQGPAVRRMGIKHIHTLTNEQVVGEVIDWPMRLVPFRFSETQSYTLVFCTLTSGSDEAVMFVAHGDGLVLDGANIFYLLFPTLDVENFDYAQSADELYIAQSGLGPRVVTRYDHDDWQLSTMDQTETPIEWGGANGWPERVTFHQQRLLFAANLTRPQTVWASEVGDFLNYYKSGDGVAADDAFTFTLNSSTQDRIKWMLSAKALNIGTMSGEWTVTGATQNAITPSNVLAQRQTNHGGESIKPLMVGITTLFVERHGRTVNEFVYDYTYDSYKISDLAILSPHITENNSIIDWTYQQVPNSVIWTVLDSGNLAAITYQRQHKVVGWHRHTTEGDFKAITSIPNATDREDEVWTIVKRTLVAGDFYYLEKLAPQFKSTDVTDGEFLDSYVEETGVISYVDSLYHLEGYEVDIIADGMVLPSQEVVSGRVDFDSVYSTVRVGLPYITEIRPYVPDIGLQDGTAYGRVQRITNVDIDLYKSLGMDIGYIDLNGDEVFENVPFRYRSDNMNEALPLFTGFKHLPFPEGYDRKIEYIIRQTLPFPLTVRGIVDTVEVFE